MSSELRTWDKGERCAECCNGDRCDDPTHYERTRCPHCKGTGWALWSEQGREAYCEHLQVWRRMSESDARTSIAKTLGQEGSAA